MSSINVGSKEAAQQLGISHSALKSYLYRYPHLRPATRFSGDDLLWSDEDIERLRQHRAAGGKGKVRKSE